MPQSRARRPELTCKAAIDKIGTSSAARATCTREGLTISSALFLNMPVKFFSATPAVTERPFAAAHPDQRRVLGPFCGDGAVAACQSK